jgi:hypothetical protein
VDAVGAGKSLQIQQGDQPHDGFERRPKLIEEERDV